MDYDIKITAKDLCYDGFFRLERYQLRHSLFAGGWSPVITRELMQKGHAAAAVLYDPEQDMVVLIEQFRIGAMESARGAWLMELVAGFIEEGETAEEVVRREALEESGCEILELMPVCRYFLSPGGSSETISLFCARVTAPPTGGIHGLVHEGEDIRVHALPFDNAMEKVASGQIDSATPILGLQWLQLNRERVRTQWRAE